MPVGPADRARRWTRLGPPGALDPGQLRAGCGGDRLRQIVEVEGLRHVVEGAAPQELPRFLFVPMSADDDDGRRVRAAFQVIQYRMPIDAGPPNVEEHDVRAEFADGANGLDAITRAVRSEAS